MYHSGPWRETRGVRRSRGGGSRKSEYRTARPRYGGPGAKIVPVHPAPHARLEDINAVRRTHVIRPALRIVEETARKVIRPRLPRPHEAFQLERGEERCGRIA